MFPQKRVSRKVGPVITSSVKIVITVPSVGTRECPITGVEDPIIRELHHSGRFIRLVSHAVPVPSVLISPKTSITDSAESDPVASKKLNCVVSIVIDAISPT